MQVLYDKCAGLDVHKDTVVACVRTAKGRGASREIKTFGTTTKQLIELFDWLAANEVSHVAMEATGVFWKPVWRVLEGGFELTLANAKQVQNVPGRKSDVSDSQWLSELLAHGLIESSFVPPEQVQDLRDLTRTRRQLIRETTQHKLRIQKVLERCNIKMGSVVTNVVGSTGRAILDALIAGERDPIKLADLAQGSIKKRKWLALAEAVRGHVRSHDVFMLDVHLKTLDALDEQIERIGQRIVEVMPEPFRQATRRLSTIPGVSDRVAETILAEVGIDMKVFLTHEHLVSWVGLCPRMDQSAGKKRSRRIRKGSPWLKPVLVQAAWAAIGKKDSYLRSFFYKLKSRHGPKKAIVAVARKLVIAAYYILRDGVEYHDLGSGHLDNLDKTRISRRLVQRLKGLGYEVELR
ncbi:IS110 family RNA-guided transposase, partial [Paraliomyxa miuraensis]|uniref:IS110 family transposase n=1 Tax=Paraliomyxa miuraensis TaxID=376150 RepID=UPI00225513C6